MATENITTKYKLDISEFKAGITEANKQIKLANAEFKAATAGMDDWSKSSDGLQAKIKQLNSTLDAQKSKLVAYRGQLEASENAYAENAKRAEELKKQLADLAVKGIEKTSAEYKQYEKQLNSVEREMTANRNAADNLRVTILNQEAAVASTEREIGNYSDELKNLDKNSEQAGEGLDKLAKRITTGVAVAITALGAAAVATGKKLWDMANETAKAGDEIDKQSQKLGVSAENYQKLSYAMERCGADVEDFRKGATNISKTLAEVQDGADEAETAIGQLGVSLKNTDGTMRSTEDVLLDTIAALADMDDETERNAAANKIFGKSYQELAPLLNSGADGIRDLMDEAEEYGMVMSDDAVKASAAFEDSLTKLKGTLGGIKNNLGAALLTPLTTLVDGFSDLAAGVDGSEQKISEGITGIVDTITKIVPAATEAITKLALELAKPENVEMLLEAGITMVAAIIDGVVKALPQLIDTALTAVGTLLSHIPGLEGLGNWMKEHKDIVIAAAGAWLTFKAAIAISNLISSVSSAVSVLAGAVSAQMAALKGATAAQTAANVAMAAAPYVALAAEIAAVVAELKFYYDSLFDVSSEVKNLQEKQRDLFREIDSGKSTREQELDQLKEKADRYEELRTKMDKTAGEELELKELAGELQDAFGDKIQVVNSLTGEYNDLTKSVDQFIEAEMRAAKMAAYKDKITEFEKAIVEAEDQMAKRLEEHKNAGFNIFDWNGAVEQQSFMNDQQATKKIIDGYNAKIDEMKAKIGEAYEDAAKDLSKTAADGTDKMTTAALKKQGLPSYVADMQNRIDESGKQAAEVIEEAADTGAETISTAAEAMTTAGGAAETLTTANDKAIESEKELAAETKKAANTMVTDTKAAYDAMNAEVKKLQENADATVKALEDEVTKLQQTYSKAVSDRASAIMGQYGLFDAVGEQEEKSGEELTKNLEDQINSIDSFYKNIDKLSQRGVSEELVESIKSMGVKASAELAAILDMSDEELKKYNDLYTKKFNVSEQIAKSELAPLKAETEAQISELTAQIDKVKEETAQKIADAKLEFMKSVATSGADFATAFISAMSGGVQKGAKSVVTQTKNAVTKAWKEAFGGTGSINLSEVIPETASKATEEAVVASVSKAMETIIKKVNSVLNRIRKATIDGKKPFESLWPENPIPMPKLQRGGVLRRGQVGLLEGTGAEAVVPLDQNAKWIKAVADDMRQELQAANALPTGGTVTNTNENIQYTQIINAPKQPSRIELYRQTRNLLAFTKGGTVNV
ncbi:MAG: phage tail tape measure protein [Ruminococcus sp.]|nr:phage tail tape measure protein [Ruminococcus sp.]